jgi:hypothetical protein
VKKTYTLFNFNALIKIFCSLLFAIGSINSSKAQSVSITSPANGSVYPVGSSSISVTANLTGFSFLSTVTFTLETLSQSVTNFLGSPYNASLNISKLAAGTYTLKASATGPFGNPTANTSISITIGGAPAISYPSTTTPLVFTTGAAISPLTPVNTGGAASSFAVSPSLPSGLGIDASSGTISGTPVALTAAKNYSVSAINLGGTSTANLNIAVVAPPDIGNYGFSKPIILNADSVGLAPATNLTSFPALVYIQDDALIIGKTCGDRVQFPTGNGPVGGTGAASPAGTNYDFAFTVTGSSTELPYEVDTYDSVNGILFAWVQVPKLNAAKIPLTFYFGSQSPNHSATFSATTWSGDYLAVYHFNEASTSATVIDATSNKRNAVQANTAVTNDEIHIAANVPIPGGGYSFNGKSSSIIQNVGTNPNITGPFTLSAWVHYNGGTNSDNKIISDELNYGHGYKLSVKKDPNTGIENIETETRTTANAAPGNLLNTGAVPSAQWVYIQGEFDGTNFINYINGKAAAKTVAGKAPEAGNIISLGIDYLKLTTDPNDTSRATNWYNGYMDEVRISNAAKSADWIKCEYYNQTKPKSFTNYSGSITTYPTTAATLTPGALIYTWTGGASSTDPTKAGNWDINAAPDFVNGGGKLSLVIPAVSSNNYPVLAANGSIYALTIANGASLNLGGFTLNVGCNIINSATTGGTGILNAGSVTSGITWNGSVLSNQSYTGTNNANTAEIGNMTTNNALSGAKITITGGPVDIFNLLTISKGSLAIDNAHSGAVTLKSAPTLTASVLTIPTGLSITGNVNVERYFKGQAGGITTADATRNYRLLSSAVNNGNGGYDLAYLNNNPGIFVSGPTGPAGGFTVLNATPTIYLYNESLPASPSTFSGGTFKGLTNIKTGNIMYYSGVGNNLVSTALSVLPVGNGIMLYYVGDNVHNVTTASALNKQSRFNGNYIAPDASTTTATGALNQGSIPVKLWWNGSTTLSDAIGGYNLVGNPYASSIDWDRLNDPSDIVGTYITKTLYVYNYMTRNYGSYQSGMSGGLGTNNATHIIASGQGFFVQAVAKTGASLTFNEGAKTAVQPNNVGGTVLLLGTPVATAPAQLLRVKLAKDSVDTDDVIILFEAASKNTYERNVDADRLAGIGNVSTLASYSSDSTNKPLAINHMHSIDSTTRIRLYVNVSPSTGVDTLSAVGLETLDQHYDAYLVDHYKKDSVLFSKYQFNINTDTASYGFYRFELVFHKKNALAYKLLTFTGVPVKGGVQLTWTTTNEQDLINFQIEREDGSKAFVSLSSLQSDGKGTYTYLDKSPLAGTNIYRLQQDDAFGNITYSNTVTVNFSNNGVPNETMSLYPNPASSQFHITINTDVPATVILKITNAIGQTMIYSEMDGNNIQQSVSNLLPGSYVVQVTDKATQKVIGVKKFIKL